MSTVFVNATQARSDTRNQGTIHTEIRLIESNVLANISAGVLYANVTGNTTMTSSNVYYNVYNGITTDTAILDQINCTKTYFVDLGYSVSILTNPTTNNTITWNLGW
jgi:hypothetical protein